MAADLDWLRDDWNQLRTQLQQAIADNAEFRAVCAGCREKIQDLSETVYGNGTPGLKICMDRIEQQAAQRREVRGAIYAVIGIVIGGACTVFGSWLQSGPHSQPAAHSTTQR